MWFQLAKLRLAAPGLVLGNAAAFVNLRESPAFAETTSRQRPKTSTDRVDLGGVGEPSCLIRAPARDRKISVLSQRARVRESGRALTELKTSGSAAQKSACSIRVSTRAFVRIERIVRKLKSVKFFVFNNRQWFESHPLRN
jgi:hypothetical protein